MSRNKTTEEVMLSYPRSIIDKLCCNQYEKERLLLEVAEYFSESNSNVSATAIKLCEEIVKTKIPVPLALCSLLREDLTVCEQKEEGVFYTDYRIATKMAEECRPILQKDSDVADFASGTGILLVAVALVYKEMYPQTINSWIKEHIFAFDLSQHALCGVSIALQSLCTRERVTGILQERWQCEDSLIENDSIAKYDIVIGNPPWGKIKLSRHSFLLNNGKEHTYGSTYDELNTNEFDMAKEDIRRYSDAIRKKFELTGQGEIDTYMPFLEKAMKAVKKGGHVVFLVPAGVIRSKGTQEIREYLFSHCSKLKFWLFDNKCNYFSIDTRFKFVLLSAKSISNDQEPLKQFDFEIVSNNKNAQNVEFDVENLLRFRTDLTVPEVLNNSERELFFKICRNGQLWGTTENIWSADIMREIDMTNDKKFFSETSRGIPVIEGRMIQQYRFGAKKYVSGKGRSAKWIPTKEGCFPQFRYYNNNMSDNLRKRMSLERVGFCDIAGQTNERAMMCALIPSGVLCGNKVPTIIFPNDDSGEAKFFWIGVANSFVFDWMIRRVISTTINYFLLVSIPLPNIDINSTLAQKIIRDVKKICEKQNEMYSNYEIGKLRADVDANVAKAYGINYEEIKIIMADFPLIDRKQPYDVEENETITRISLYTSFCENDEYERNKYTIMREKLEKQGAKAYIPSEMICLCGGGTHGR